ncbi:MAG: GbsR/MarR family transcriptional regulator [Propionibacteriaceae bacterium]
MSDALDAETTVFIEDFATAWDSLNASRMEGRVLGLLIISDEPYLSALQIAQLLQASAGAISMATRSLVSIGIINRHTVPGDRRHFFRVEDDVWGTFLAGERDNLRRMSVVIRSGLHTDAGKRPSPHRRLVIAERYMTWLRGYQRQMIVDWYAYRDAIDALPEGAATSADDDPAQEAT